MQYKITRQYARGTEDQIAQFKELKDAKAFIMMKMEEDVAQRIMVIYRILDRGNSIVEEFDPVTQSTQSAQNEQSSQGQQSTASFRPTPFNTTPRPAGTPQKWQKDDEDEKK